MTQRQAARASDRWVTPGVVVAGIVCGSLVVVAVAGLVAYLAVLGIDPSPVVQLATAVTAGVGSIGTLVLQLVGRKTVTKVERATGIVARAVADQLVEVRPGDTGRMPAVPPPPPVTARHRWPADWPEHGSGPAAGGA